MKTGLPVALFAGGQQGESLIELFVSGTVFNYNVFNMANTIGSPEANVVDGVVRITYSIGARIGSTHTSIPACSSGSGWGTGWRIEHYIASGGCRIQGKGGAGGNGRRGGFLDPDPPNGCILQQTGGGGGGSGTQAGDGGSRDGEDGLASSGGSGGPGSTFVTGGCQSAMASSGQPGGPALSADSGGPDHYIMPAAGATFEIWGGGGGGGGSGSKTAPGGAGGGPGLGGSTGSSGAAGGAAGAAYVELGGASIIEVGPGVIDKRGA